MFGVQFVKYFENEVKYIFSNELCNFELTRFGRKLTKFRSYAFTGNDLFYVIIQQVHFSFILIVSLCSTGAKVLYIFK